MRSKAVRARALSKAALSYRAGPPPLPPTGKVPSCYVGNVGRENSHIRETRAYTYFQLIRELTRGLLAIKILDEPARPHRPYVNINYTILCAASTFIAASV